jgi:LysR family hydrogen peroxide-inducible transcriptional activator
MNLSGLSLRDLEYVVAIADHGSFVRAAEHCRVAQPSLSAQVRKLESWLGIVIFERTTRRVIVTAEGNSFIEQARRVLAEARLLLTIAQRSDEPFGGSLRLAAISTLGPYLFPRILPGIRKEVSQPGPRSERGPDG